MKSLVLMLFISSPVLAGPKTAPLDIQADRMELTQKSGVLRFEGHVIATQAEFALRCQRLVATYNKAGELSEIRAEAVTVTAKNLEARARTATWRRASGTLVLRGKPSVKRGADRLTGDTITFWPEAGRMVVEQARGTLQAPKLDGIRAP